MKVKLKTKTPDIEKAIVEIARVSSKRKDKAENLSGLINYLIKNSHWSPFEHGHITVEIVTSKAMSIQLLRHRSFSFQEFSQRYSEVEQFEPIELRRQHENNRQSSSKIFDPEIRYREDNAFTDKASHAIDILMEESANTYQILLDVGVARECARMVLPMCTQTKVYMTGSIRSWIHFLEVRDDKHAQKEMQLIAKEIKKIFKATCPLISAALNY